MSKVWVLIMAFVVTVAVCPSLGQAQGLMTGDEIIQQLEKKPDQPATRAIRIGKPKDQAGQAMEQQAPQPAPAPPSVTFYVYFKTASTEVADQFSLAQLAELGKALRSPALANAQLEIGGHTDSRGSDEYNLQLSWSRASAIKQYLVSNFGVNPANLIARGYGESMPAYSNETEEGMAKNRRVVVKRLD